MLFAPYFNYLSEKAKEFDFDVLPTIIDGVPTIVNPSRIILKELNERKEGKLNPIAELILVISFSCEGKRHVFCCVTHIMKNNRN